MESLESMNPKPNEDNQGPKAKRFILRVFLGRCIAVIFAKDFIQHMTHFFLSI